jgi:recombination protein RecT
MATEKKIVTKSADLVKVMDQFKDQIEMALPKHMTAERMMRLAMTAYNRTPDLAQCTGYSIMGAIVQASILGLECDGMSGEAYLIPYYNGKTKSMQCQMQAGYRGLVKLARQSGEFTTIDSQPVYVGDVFEFEKGSTTWLKHKRDPTKPRGEVYGFWAGYNLKDGGFNFEYMHKTEIEAHRDKYSKSAYVLKYDEKAGKKVPLMKDGKPVLADMWQNDSGWMYRKTPLIQVLKLAPKSIELRTAMTLTERSEAGLAQMFADPTGKVELPKELSGPIPVDDEFEDEIAEPKPNTGEPKKVEVLVSSTQAARIDNIAVNVGYQPMELQIWLQKNLKVQSPSEVKAQDFDRVCKALEETRDL